MCYNTRMHMDFPDLARAKALFERLHGIGFSAVLLSNNKEPRVKSFAREVRYADYIFKAGKPSPKGYREAMKRMGTDESTTFFVGDQLFTDIRGGNIVGAVTVFVNPARKETRNVKVFESRRRREKPILEEFDRINGVKANEEG